MASNTNSNNFTRFFRGDDAYLIGMSIYAAFFFLFVNVFNIYVISYFNQWIPRVFLLAIALFPLLFLFTPKSLLHKYSREIDIFMPLLWIVTVFFPVLFVKVGLIFIGASVSLLQFLFRFNNFFQKELEEKKRTENIGQEDEGQNKEIVKKSRWLVYWIVIVFQFILVTHRGINPLYYVSLYNFWITVLITGFIILYFNFMNKTTAWRGKVIQDDSKPLELETQEVESREGKGTALFSIALISVFTALLFSYVAFFSSSTPITLLLGSELPVATVITSVVALRVIFIVVFSHAKIQSRRWVLLSLLISTILFSLPFLIYAPTIWVFILYEMGFVGMMWLLIHSLRTVSETYEITFRNFFNVRLGFALGYSITLLLLVFTLLYSQLLFSVLLSLSLGVGVILMRSLKLMYFQNPAAS